jgi:hypothetical protein
LRSKAAGLAKLDERAAGWHGFWWGFGLVIALQICGRHGRQICFIRLRLT